MQLFYIVISFMIVGTSSFLLLRNSFTRNTKNLTMSHAVKTLVANAIKENKVMVFSKSFCPYCSKTKNTLSGLNIEFTAFELDVSKHI